MTSDADSSASPGMPAGHAAIPEIDPTQLRQFLASGERHLLLDVREPRELEAGHIEGQVNIPLGQLVFRMSELDGWQDELVVCICRVGIRSRFAAELLHHSGFKRLANLAGGYVAWQADDPCDIDSGEAQP